MVYTNGDLVDKVDPMKLMVSLRNIETGLGNFKDRLAEAYERNQATPGSASYERIYRECLSFIQEQYVKALPSGSELEVSVRVPETQE